jgi:hypothetical protein
LEGAAMSAVAVLKAARDAGVSVRIDGNELLLEAPKRPSEQLLIELSRSKAEIHALLGGKQPTAGAQRNPGSSSNVDTLGGEHVDFEERAALIEDGTGALREWAEGFARLNLAGRPTAFSKAQWEQLLDDAGRFLDDGWAVKTAKAGWSVLDVFGVHPLAPNARYDAMGLIPLIRGGALVDIRSDRAVIKSRSGNNLTFYLRRDSAEAVALWDLAADPQKENPQPLRAVQNDDPHFTDTSESEAG